MNHPPCIIQSRRNGKFYPVNVEDGEVDLNGEMKIHQTDLEYYYGKPDKHERFWVYTKHPTRTLLQRVINKILPTNNIPTNH